MSVLLAAAGPRSGRMAQVLAEALAPVAPGCRVALAATTDASGLRQRLAEAELGILCVVPEDVRDPWLHYLLGAVSGSVRDPARTLLFLLGLGPAELEPPLSWHAAVAAGRDGAGALLDAVRRARGEPAAAPAERERLWAELEAPLRSVGAIEPELGREPTLAGGEDSTAVIRARELFESDDDHAAPTIQTVAPPVAADAAGARGAGRYQDAIEALRRSIALNPGNAAARTTLGNLLLRAGRVSEALDSFRDALQLEPSSLTAHGGHAAALVGLGRVDEAIRELRRSLELHPDSAVAWKGLGDALHRMGRIAEAIEALRKAQALASEDPGVLAGLGSALRAGGDLEGAADALRRAIYLDPADAYAHVNLGRVLRSQGRLEEAIRVQRRALELAPGDGALYKSLATTLRAQGEHDEALRVLRRAVELDPGQAAYQNDLALALLSLGRLEEAAEALRRSVEIAHAAINDGRAGPSVYNDLGVAHFHQGKLDEAILALRRAIELDPTSGPIRRNLDKVIRAQEVRRGLPPP